MTQSKVKDENYIVIQGFMINKLNLKGNELLIYAVIYGFSQTEEQVYSGSLQYLADWTNSTKQGVTKNLKSLVEKGFIIKNDKYINGVKFCEYRTTKLDTVLNKVEQGMQQSLTGVLNKVEQGIQQSCNNNIEYNLINNINNNIEDNIVNKEAINYEKIVGRLNELTGASYWHDSKNTRTLIKSRFKEGFTEEDFITVIDKMCYLWNREPKKGQTDMRLYLRPSTLFGTKFEQYLNMNVTKVELTTKDLASKLDFSEFHSNEKVSDGQLF